jgi:hypothetical protein
VGAREKRVGGEQTHRALIIARLGLCSRIWQGPRYQTGSLHKHGQGKDINKAFAHVGDDRRAKERKKEEEVKKKPAILFAGAHPLDFRPSRHLGPHW